MDEVQLDGLRDVNGFAPIGDYGVLGDGRGTALVAGDGSVDWWAVPRLDSQPAFPALLDPERGGCVQLRPVATNATSTRRYIPDTNLLETTFTTAMGQVRITDSLNSGSAGALPWSELARRVEGVDGTVELAFSVAPGDGMRRWEPWTDDANGPILHAGGLVMALRCSREIDVRIHPHHVEGELRVAAGERRVLAVVAADNDPLFLCDVASINDRVDLTAESWKRWSTQVNWDGAGRERIVRSALALKTLIIAQTGAVAAAATTSLPERIGGDKNWDYRFAWVRDASMTIEALSALGLQEEVQAAVSWLLQAIRANGPGVHVMYGLDGQLPTDVRQPTYPVTGRAGP